jgi:hypothetical protein
MQCHILVNYYIYALYVPAPLAANGLAFCIYGFYMIFSVVSDYFLKQLYQVDLCNGEVWCSLWGTGWILKYRLDELGL